MGSPLLSLVVTLLFLPAWSPAWGAYRLYQLKITHLDAAKRVETVLSTLDPNQYAAFHNEMGRASIELINSWYCPGDTSRRPPCEQPKVNDRTPASTYPSRSRLPYSMQPVIP